MINKIKITIGRRKGFISLGELERRTSIQHRTYKPITLLKKVVAYSLIGLGVSTLPLPTGSIFFIMGGCALLGIDYKKLLNTISLYSKGVKSWVGLVAWKVRNAYNMAKFERGFY